MLWFFLVLYFNSYLWASTSTQLFEMLTDRITNDWKHILSEIKSEGRNPCIFLPASTHNLSTATSTPMQRFCKQNPLTMQQNQNLRAPGHTQAANAMAAVMCFKEQKTWQGQNFPSKWAKWAGAEGQAPPGQLCIPALGTRVQRDALTLGSTSVHQHSCLGWYLYPKGGILWCPKWYWDSISLTLIDFPQAQADAIRVYVFSGGKSVQVFFNLFLLVTGFAHCWYKGKLRSK